MRFCLNLTTIFRADLEAAVRAAAGAGFGAIELWVDSLERYLEAHAIDDLRALLETNRLEVISIGDVESVTFCEPDRFEELRGRCEKLAAVANAISCPTIVLSASVRPRGVSEGLVAEEAASALGKLLDVVEPAGVGLALAFRGFSWCAVNTLEQAREAVEAHSGRRAGLVLDTFDLHATGEQPDALKAIDPAHVFVVRMSDCEDLPPALLSETGRVLPGEGVAPLEEMLRAFSDVGWSGYVSLKIPSPKLMGLDADEAAKVVMAVSEPYLGVAPAKERK
jgi:4-hydroxyphenylpyruvate dioxygenase